MLLQHDAVRAGMEQLSRRMEQMRMERASELETTAQVKEMLQRTMSASSLLEARHGQVQTEQAQMHIAAEEAKAASDCALVQAACLCEEQEWTSQQMIDILSAKADDMQKHIQSATSVAIQTQQEVRTLSAMARTADLTAKMTSEKVERQVETMQQAI